MAKWGLVGFGCEAVFVAAAKRKKEKHEKSWARLEEKENDKIERKTKQTCMVVGAKEEQCGIEA